MNCDHDQIGPKMTTTGCWEILIEDEIELKVKCYLNIRGVIGHYYSMTKGYTFIVMILPEFGGAKLSSVSFLPEAKLKYLTTSLSTSKMYSFGSTHPSDA